MNESSLFYSEAFVRLVEQQQNGGKVKSARVHQPVDAELSMQRAGKQGNLVPLPRVHAFTESARVIESA